MDDPCCASITGAQAMQGEPTRTGRLDCVILAVLGDGPIRRGHQPSARQRCDGPRNGRQPVGPGCEEAAIDRLSGDALDGRHPSMVRQVFRVHGGRCTRNLPRSDCVPRFPTDTSAGGAGRVWLLSGSRSGRCRRPEAGDADDGAGDGIREFSTILCHCGIGSLPVQMAARGAGSAGSGAGDVRGWKTDGLPG